jgi:predicted amidohydrolase YtcJ
MTHGAAYAEFAEGAKGTITVGALADLAVLSADVFTAAEDRLSSIHSVLTLIGGQPVHDTGIWRQ